MLNEKKGVLRVGLDVGSTTAKMVCLRDGERQPILARYQRHQAQVMECLAPFLQELRSVAGNEPIAVSITGSVGLGIAERAGLPFVQEIVAAARYAREYHPEAVSMIDIGGEDAKVVFFNNGKVGDARMNGNCAGGTGAFIDQMAVLLDVSVDTLNDLALRAQKVYPIASRCGVFCKTDIQNLIAKNAAREDIAASIFRAVTVQTIITLAKGYDIVPPILLCGGPLTFIPALRKSFADYLGIGEEGFILPENANVVPAWGTALSAEGATMTLDELEGRIALSRLSGERAQQHLAPIFTNQQEYDDWKEKMARNAVQRVPITPGKHSVFLGIDSGSTTTKIVVTNEADNILYSYYKVNQGDPIQTVLQGLQQLEAECRAVGAELEIVGSCSTGYGEDLVRVSFGMGGSIIETMAHYMAARHIKPEVSFILDIGGQDMKAIFIRNGAIARIEINEACSSGCGSFISTFAHSLNFGVEEFAAKACLSPAPCDLGTRCTVFMNSRVKQVLRDGATVADISAGLAYSVVKNCLFKVLQLKGTHELGEHIVVQGGTMRNDAIVRGLERLTHKNVYRSSCPELMGALGCAIYARQSANRQAIPLSTMLQLASYKTTQLQCKGCENLCSISRYVFDGNRAYFSGNRCEKYFTNRGAETQRGRNAYEEKYALLFDRTIDVEAPRLTIGIPRALNMYEEYPFWHALFSHCGIRVVLSSSSTFQRYEASANRVMSDNICFPAKLVHSHIQQLQEAGVDRIFMPIVVFEKKDQGHQNSYNCPIVSGYAEVVKSVQGDMVPVDSPAITLKEDKLLLRQCELYLGQLGISKSAVRAAFKQAVEAQTAYESALQRANQTIYDEAQAAGQLTIMLAGRPYHTDPLIQHKIGDMIAALGVNVITDDMVRGLSVELDERQFLSQWAFTNRILKAAQWAGQQPPQLQYMQFTSFGCGPDAFLTDEVRAILRRHGKNLTLLKIDDISNTGSIKLRIRSLVDSLALSLKEKQAQAAEASVSTPIYTQRDRRRKILAPYFTPFLSPLIPSIIAIEGYDMEILPMSDEDACQWGLRYSNNEVCYPATLIVGDIVKALRSGRYKAEDICVALTQTGGQCRASNYLPLIKKALIDNGFGDVPVLSFALGSGIDNTQPGFKVNWLRLIPIILSSLLYSDSLAKFYFASKVRERHPGQAKRLLDHYLEVGKSIIPLNKPDRLLAVIPDAAADFDAICEEKTLPKVGIVGEIYLKFNPFAQKDISAWLMDRGIEVMPPVMLDFFTQSFVNKKAQQDEYVSKRSLPNWIIDRLHAMVQSRAEKVNRLAKPFRYWTPFESIYHKASMAKQVITLNAQFGEGWLIPGELFSFAAQGVNHVVSVQPFGCIANHIVQKGIEKRIRALLPDLSVLSLDFDSSVSDVNIVNRLLLFIDSLKQTAPVDESVAS